MRHVIKTCSDMLGNRDLSRRGIEGAEIDGCHFNLFQHDGCPTAKGIKFSYSKSAQPLCHEGKGLSPGAGLFWMVHILWHFLELSALLNTISRED